MTTGNYTKIFSGSFIIVNVLKERLNNVGIKYIIKDESESGRLAGFGASIQNLQEVYIHEDELDKAIPLVNQVKAETETQ